jgi:hypothetical protein
MAGRAAMLAIRALAKMFKRGQTAAERREAKMEELKNLDPREFYEKKEHVYDISSDDDSDDHVEMDDKSHYIHDQETRERRQREVQAAVEANNERRKAQLEIEPETPWNWWFTRVDQMAYITPLDTLKYYFVKHSTGPSYMFLVAFLSILGIYISLVAGRIVDNDLLQNSQVQFAEDEESIGLPLPLTVAVTASNGSAITVNPAYFSVDFWSCVSTIAVTVSGTTTLTSRTEDCGTTAMLKTFNTDGTIGLSAGSEPILRGHQGSTFQRFIRIRITACATSGGTNCTSVSNAQTLLNGAVVTVKGQSIATDEQTQLYVGTKRVTNTATITTNIISGLRHRPTIEYTQLEVFHHARYFVDRDIFFYLHLSGEKYHESKFNATNGVFYDAALQMLPESDRVYETEITFIDAIAAIAALMMAFYLVSTPIRWWNRWHFNNFGEFQNAGMPTVFTDLLLDPDVSASVTGLPDMVKMNKFGYEPVRTIEFQATCAALIGIRQSINNVISRDGTKAKLS